MTESAEAAAMDLKDAIVGIVVGAMHADGRALRSEFQTATLHLEALESVDVSVTDVRARAERLEAQYASLGPDAFLDRCVAALPPTLHVAVFKAVVAVVAADDDVDDAEVVYLRALARKLDVPPAEADAALPK